LTGQNEKIGHFLQPTARATGQRTIWDSSGAIRASEPSLHRRALSGGEPKEGEGEGARQRVEEGDEADEDVRDDARRRRL